MRLLIIDDDVAHGESLTDLLQTRGHEAYFARSFPEACWLLDLFRFQLAVVDYDMPGLNGLELFRRLRTQDATLKAIIMSAREPDGRLLEELESTPFLPKPFRVKQLLEAISRTLPTPLSSPPMLRVSFSLQRLEKKS